MYIEGKSGYENKFAGIQIRALKATPETRIRTIMDQGIPKGRIWNIDNSLFFMLQNIDGRKIDESSNPDRKIQAEAMFQQTRRIFQTEGTSYQDVVRTWIYISDILDWYNNFNSIKNKFFAENGFLQKTNSKLEAEEIYLPASTGIEGRNPSNSTAAMDVFTVHPSPESNVKIRTISGTASINEQGKSIFIGDPAYTACCFFVDRFRRCNT